MITITKRALLGKTAVNYRSPAPPISLSPLGERVRVRGVRALLTFSLVACLLSLVPVSAQNERGRILATSEQAYVNLVKNASYEAFSSGANSAPDGFVTAGLSAGTGSIAKDATAKYQASAVKLTQTNATGSYVLRYDTAITGFGASLTGDSADLATAEWQRLTLSSAAGYVASVWVKLPGGASNPSALTIKTDADQKVYIELTANSNNDYAYIDGLQVTEGHDALAFMNNPVTDTGDQQIFGDIRIQDNDSANYIILDKDTGNISASGTISATAENANTLDGLDSTQFLRSDIADEMTGTLTLSPASGHALVTTAGNVGIGTTSPGKKLDVVGDVKFTGDVYTTGTTYLSNGTTYFSGSSGAAFKYVSGVISDGLSIGASYLSTAAPANGAIIQGNVGISQTSPTYKLDVTGDIRSTTGAYFATSSGNVGVGTTGPNEKLQVSGNIRASGTDARIYATDSTTSAWMDAVSATGIVSIGAYSNSRLDITRNASPQMTFATTGNVGISQTSPTYKLDVTGDIRSTTGAYFATTSGNVGVGTTGPGRTLEVRSTTNGAATYAYARIAAQTDAAYGGSSRLEGYYQDTGNGEAAKLGWVSFDVNRVGAGDVGGKLSIYTKTTGGALADNPTVKMTIDSIGNVGIGTTGPGAKLDVVGTVAVGSSSNIGANTTAKMRFGYYNSGTAPYTTYGVIQTPQNVGIQIQNEATGVIAAFGRDGAGQNQSYFAGNVGIGTTGPLAKLQVAGSVGNEFLAGQWAGVSDTNGGEAVFGMNAYGANSTIFRYSNTHASIGASGIIIPGFGDGAIKFFINTGASTQDAQFTPDYKMVIANSGNVGIGSASPTQKLDIVGNIALTGTIDGRDISADINQAVKTTDSPTFAGATISGAMTVGGGYGSTGITMSTDGNLQVDGSIYLKGNIWRENLQELLVKNNTITLNDGGSAQDGFIKVSSTLGQIKWDNTASKWKITNDGTNFYDIANPYTAGNGLALTGQDFSVNVDSSTLEINADTLRVKDAGITSAKLATGIDATKLADGSITSAELQYINTLSSNAQTQLDSKLNLAGGSMTGDLNLNSTGTATSGVTTYDSNKIALKGSYWDGAASQASGFTLQNDTTANNAYKLSIFDKTGTNEIAYLDQAGGLYLDGPISASQIIGVLSGSVNADQVNAGSFQNSAYTFPNNLTVQGTLTGTLTGSASLNVLKAGDTMTGALTLSPSSGNALVTTAGNVGIGTTGPGATLDINGTVRSNNSVTIQNNSGILYFNAAAGDTLGYIQGRASTDFILHYNQPFRLRNATNGNIVMATSGSDIGIGGTAADTAPVMKILTTGNVGIGTTNPEYKLEVVGSGGIAIKINNNQALGWRNAANDSTYGIMKLDSSNVTQILSGNTGAQGIQFRAFNGSTVLMNIDNSGNVGIGTTGPGAKLHVSGGSALIVPASNIGENLVMHPGAGATSANFTLNALEYGAAGAQQFIFNVTNDTDLARISTSAGGVGATQMPIQITAGGTGIYLKTDGNVGIGTTNPGTALTLGGTVTTGVATIPKIILSEGQIDASSRTANPVSAPTAALNATAGNVSGTNIKYIVTFVTPIGETIGGPSSNTIASAASQRIDLTNIPTGTANVTSRKIYRTDAAQNNYWYVLIGTINDNTTTTYQDNTTEPGYAANPAPSVNTAGGSIIGVGTMGVQELDASSLIKLGSVSAYTNITGSGTGIGISSSGASTLVALSNGSNGDTGFSFSGAGTRGTFTVKSDYSWRLNTDPTYGSTMYLQDAVNKNVSLAAGGGNVGIGTTGPLQRFHVVNSTVTGAAAPVDGDYMVLDNNGAFYINFRASTGATGGQGLLFSDDTRNVGAVYYNHSDNSLNFRAGGGDRFAIGSAGNGTLTGNLVVQGTGNTTIAGNVGIGSTAPTAKLDVAGNIALTGTIDGRDISADINQAVKTTDSPTFNALTVTNGLTVGGGYGSTGITMSTDGNLQVDGNIYLKGNIWRENLQELLVKNNTITLNDGGSAQDGFIKVSSTLGQIKWDNTASKWKITNDGTNFYDIANPYTAGNGLALTGQDFSVNVDSSTLEINADTLRVKDAGITSAKLATGIDATKLADGSITSAELQYINTLSSNAQTQLDSKLNLAGGSLTGDLNLNSAGTATSGVTTYDSQKIALKGSYWDGAASQASGFTIQNDTTANNAYKLSIFDKTGTNEIAYLDQSGGLYLDGPISASQIIGVLSGSVNADQVNAGTFQNALYTFPNNLTVSGTLNLAANGLIAGTNQLVLANGNVGIGTTVPSALLYISGNSSSYNLISQGYIQGINGGRFQNLLLGGASGVGNSAMKSTTGGYIDLQNDVSGALTLATALNTTASPAMIINSRPNVSELLLQIQKSGAAVMTVDNSGNVGIGTTGPGYTLDVNGTFRATTYGIIDGIYIGYNNAISMGNASDGRMIQFGDTSVSDLILKGYTAGNVGIGTTVPNDTLVINGGVRSSYIYVGLPTSPDGLLNSDGSLAMSSDSKVTWVNGTTLFGNSTDTGLARNAAGVVEINNGTAGQYRDLQVRSINPTSGNVGIGTTMPEGKLDVAGTLRVASAGDVTLANDLYFENTTASAINSYGPLTVTSGNPNANYDLTLKGTGTGKVIIDDDLQITGTTTFPSGLTVASGNITASSGNVSASAGSGTFGTLTVTGAANLATTSGNVGISQTSPTYKLDITGDIRSTAGAYFATTSGNVGVGTTTPVASLAVSGPVGSYGTLYVKTTQNQGNGNVAVFDAGNAANRFVISDAGSIRSAGTAMFNNSVNNAGLTLIDATGGSGASKISMYDGSGAVANLFSGNGVSYINSGNVGIGTTAPGALLEVNGNQLIDATNAEALLVRKDSDSGDVFAVDTSNSLVLVKGGSLANAVGTKFSMGGTSPSATFEIADGYNDNRTTFRVISRANDANQYVAHLTGDAAGFDGEVLRLDVNDVASTSFNFLRAISDVDGTPVTHFIVRGDGNVGIGTTGPGSKLQINTGATTAVGLIVQAVASQSGNLQEWQNSTGVVSLAIGPGGNTIFARAGNLTGTGINITPNGNITTVSGDYIAVGMNGNFAPTSGTGTFAQLSVNGTINQTGGANGITRGLYVNPTLTAAADFRAIETVTGNIIFGSTSGNVGIGTTDPGAYKLNVNGNAKVSGNLDVTGTISAASLAGTTATTGTSSQYFALDSDYNEVNPELRFQTGASTYETLAYDETGLQFNLSKKLNLGANNLITTGNVGISQTSPTYKLDITGDIRSTAGAYFATTSGNVGVGTTAPGAKLEVNGGYIKLTNSNSQVYGLYDNRDVPNGYASIYATPVAGGGTVSGIYVVPQQNGASTGVYGVQSYPKVGTSATVTNGYGLYTRAFPETGTMTNYYGIYVDAPMGAGVVTNKYDAIFNGGGNVGIGTTNPGSNLEVSGSGAQEFRLDSSGSNSTLIVDVANSSVAKISLRRANGEKAALFADGNTGRTGFSYDNTYPFGIIPLDSGGTFLNIQRESTGYMKVFGGRNSTSGVGNHLIIQGGETNDFPAGNLILRGGNATGTGTDGDIIVQNSEGVTEYLRILESSGNVGIGTTSPGTRLEVSGGGITVTGANNYVGAGWFTSTLYTSTGNNVGLTLQDKSFSSAGNAVQIAAGAFTNTSGASSAVKIIPTYNQVTSTAANTDLLINRTETAVGSGAQNLIDAQVGGVSKFTVTNTGAVTTLGAINGQTIAATSTLNNLDVSGALTVGGGYGSTGLSIDSSGNLKLDGDIWLKGVFYRPTFTDLQVQNNSITLNASDAPADLDAYIGAMSGGTKASPTYTGLLKWNATPDRWDFGTAGAPNHVYVSGNVGIGSATPGQKLDVAGNITATGTVTASGGSSTNWNSAYSHSIDTTGAVHGATSANTVNMIVRRDGSGNFSAGAITANLTGTVTGSASLNVLKAGDTMTGSLNMSGVTNDITTPANEHIAIMPGGTGNVGIGTTAPGATLDVNGGSNANLVSLNQAHTYSGDINNVVLDKTFTFTINSGTRSAGNGKQTGVRNALNISSGNSVAIDSAWGQENYVTNNNGAGATYIGGLYNIVFNNNSQTTAYSVGSINQNFAQGNAVVTTGIGSENSNMIQSSGTARYTSAIGSRVQGVNSFGGSTQTIGNAYGLYVLDSIKGGGTITSNYGIYLDSIAAGSTNYAIYSAGGQSYFGGNVGIGSTSPGQKLDVTGNVNVSGTLTAANIVGVVTGNVNANQVNAGSFQNGAYTFPNNVIVSGNIGIGTASPADKFEIAGVSSNGIKLSGTNATITSGDNLIEVASSNIYLRPGANYYAIVDAGKGLTVTSGNVGIGTAAPAAKLDVSSGQLRVNNSPNSDALYFKGGPGGAGSTAGIAFDATGVAFGGNVSARLNFVDDGAYGAHITFENRTGSQGTTTAEKMRVTTSGNVGIGTTSPTNKLEIIAGDIAIDNTKKLKLEGPSGDTFIYRTADNRVVLAVDGVDVADWIKK